VDVPEKTDKAGSWWLTLPGLLTGGAAVVTAVTGLILGLHQVGWLGDDGVSASKDTPPAAVSSPPSTQGDSPAPAGATGAPAGGRFAVAIPLNTSYKSGTVAYSVTAATAEPDVDDQLRLTLTVRAVNSAPYDMGLWDRNFGVVVGADSFAATSGLNKIVHGNSTGSGQAVFVLPANTTDAKLVFRFLEGDRTVPFTVTPSAG
jgi:hypothetical protein